MMCVFSVPQGVVFCWGRADSGQLGIGAEWVHETSSGVMGVEWPRRVRGLLEGRRTVRQSNQSKANTTAVQYSSRARALLVPAAKSVRAGVHKFVLICALFIRVNIPWRGGGGGETSSVNEFIYIY